MFAAALFLLLKDVLNRVERIVIDAEYTGYEADIRSMLLTYFWQENSLVYKEQLLFGTIGKKSPAHRRALATYRGQLPPSRTIREHELRNVLGRKKE